VRFAVSELTQTKHLEALELARGILAHFTKFKFAQSAISINLYITFNYTIVKMYFCANFSLEVAHGYKSPCEESIQCTESFGTHSECKKRECTCTVNHHFSDMECWEDKGKSILTFQKNYIQMIDFKFFIIIKIN